MATLDLTSFRAEDGSNTKRRIQGIYTGPAAYVAGGDAITAVDIKLGQIHRISFGIAWSGTATRLVVYDYTNNKVVWYVPNTGAEASGDLSAYTTRFEAIGV